MLLQKLIFFSREEGLGCITSNSPIFPKVQNCHSWQIFVLKSNWGEHAAAGLKRKKKKAKTRPDPYKKKASKVNFRNRTGIDSICIQTT